MRYLKVASELDRALGCDFFSFGHGVQTVGPQNGQESVSQTGQRVPATRTTISNEPSAGAKQSFGPGETRPNASHFTRDRGENYMDAIKQAAPAAIQVADRWHLLKNWREALEHLLNRHLMVLHTLNGNRAEALRVYRTCATILQRELAVGPSPITYQLYERLQAERQPRQSAVE